MKTLFTFLSALAVSLAPLHRAQAHLFTDTDGHQAEAEPVGFVGGKLLLSAQGVRGLWPLERLTERDNVYIAKWRESSLVVAKVNVELTEQAGLGTQGTFPGDSLVPGGTWKHYDIKITNPAFIPSTALRVDYQIYVIAADGRVETCAGTQWVAPIPPTQTSMLSTEGVNFQGTKAAHTALMVANPSKSRRLGGICVHVTDVGCQMLGRTCVLDPELNKLSPSWTGPDYMTEVVELKSLDELEELAKKTAKDPAAAGTK